MKFVQGVAVDPKFEYIVTASNDRSVKIWHAIKTKKNQVGFNCIRTLKKFEFPNRNEDEEEGTEKNFRIFMDESVPTFFRRPDVSPDGQLYLLPAGIWQSSPDD